MNRDLDTVFGELGLSQYLDSFVDQGFDTWETILDIQESDLDALGVKLGHRRKLQRRIANARGIAPSVLLANALSHNGDDAKPNSPNALKRESTRSEAGSEGNGVTKRKYRRHPKPDENAPERPPSAYVLFSNKMREDLKSQNLTFTEIAKLVGENWQSLDPAERESYESQANAAKTKYKKDMATYKKTPEYKKYQQYLQEFKEKQARHNQAVKPSAGKAKSPSAATSFCSANRSPRSVHDSSKRPKLDSKPEPAKLRHDSSHGSTSSAATPNGTVSSGSGSGSSSERFQESEPPPARRRRVDSVASIAESQMSSTAPTAISHRGSFEENGISPRGGFLDGVTSGETGRPPHRQGPWLGRGPPQEAGQQLPSLSDMLEDKKQPPPILPCNAGMPPTMTQSPPVMHRDIPSKTSSVSGTSNISRPTGDGGLPIHALLSNQDGGKLYEKAPVPNIGPSIPTDAAGAVANQTPGYGFLSNSPTFRHMKTEQAGDGDVVMTTVDAAPSNVRRRDKAEYDGMSALIHAGEIVGRRARR
ncbi:hypothetical protein K4F52_005824 [Lecanicillium sp. MT-2017a]|nr:hypothetical protein K4F52_005824 [Lecanicillium sp. MT-2017a]